MSQWIDRVRQHTAWSAINAVEPSIDAALTRDGLPPEAVDSLERLRTVAKFAGSRLSATDPALITPAALNNLAPSLSQLQANIDAFITSGDINHINAANSHADAFLSNLTLVFGGATPSELSTAAEAATSYRQTLEKYLASATTQQASLLEKASINEEKIKAIEAALTAEQQKLATLVSEQQSQFSSAQDKRASEFATSQADYLDKYTAAASEQKTQFSADQDSRRTAFSDFQRENQEKLSILFATYDQKLKDHSTEFEAKEKLADDEHKNNLHLLNEKYEKIAAGILEEIKKHKADVESLVGVIGNLGVTSGYKKVANYARAMLVVWQFFTVLALAGLIAVATMVVFPSWFGVKAPADHVTLQGAVELKNISGTGLAKATAEKSSAASVDMTTPSEAPLKNHSDADFYQGFFSRLFLSITFGIFAAYAGRQASRFFEMEQKNRKLALELEALGPFIEPLDKSDRDKFRVQIGDRSFGVPDSEQGKTKDEEPVTALAVLKSKEISEFISNIVKAAKS